MGEHQPLERPAREHPPQTVQGGLVYAVKNAIGVIMPRIVKGSRRPITPGQVEVNRQKGVQRIDLGHDGRRPEIIRKGQEEGRTERDERVPGQPEYQAVKDHDRQRGEKGGHQVEAVGHAPKRQVGKPFADEQVERVARRVHDAQ
jgi:hypothetical protein